MMGPNPVLRKLGFDARDRVVIIHADDVGMCQSSVPAFVDLMEVGLVSSGAIMVPCPWFPYAAEACGEHPDLDVGVHLTLTSEWERYRWGPISTCDPASGLLDPEGYFHYRSEEVQESGEPSAVQVELESQVARALAAGIDVTHVDTHMGTVAHHRFFGTYVQTAAGQGLPFMAPRLDEAGWRELGLDETTGRLATQFLHELEAQGYPLVDRVIGLPLVPQPEDRLALAKQILASLPVGLTHLIIHPAIDTPELRALTRSWRSRVADYETFVSLELSRYVRDIGLQIIGYRPLRDLMQASASTG